MREVNPNQWMDFLSVVHSQKLYSYDTVACPSFFGWVKAILLEAPKSVYDVYQAKKGRDTQKTNWQPN